MCIGIYFNIYIYIDRIVRCFPRARRRFIHKRIVGVFPALGRLLELKRAYTGKRKRRKKRSLKKKKISIII